MKKPQPRKRRAPDEARTEILDAAERVFSRMGPDAAGLKEIAREAGISHGLVTHYFGTYDALVQAVLDRHFSRAREAALATVTSADWRPEAAPLLRIVFDAVRNPSHVRLATWALLRSEGGPSPIPFADGELAPLLEALKDRRSERLGRPLTAEERRETELTMLFALSAAYGFALGKESFLRALGRASTPELSREFEDSAVRLLQREIQRSDAAARRAR